MSAIIINDSSISDFYICVTPSPENLRVNDDNHSLLLYFSELNSKLHHTIITSSPARPTFFQRARLDLIVNSNWSFFMFAS
jgi:hypothetical protein